MENKAIIFVHGLASKPVKNQIQKYWQKIVLNNICQIDCFTKENIFNFAYWADCIPTHIPLNKKNIKNLENSINNLIKLRKNFGSDFHIGAGESVKHFFAEKGVELLNIFTNAMTIKDNIINFYLDEIKLYTSDQYIADKIRKTLEKQLISAWNKSKEVMIISHSMGSIISYDVLWRFSHSGDSFYKKYRKKRVKNFTTMGSPLGDNFVKNILLNRKSSKREKEYYPTNIDVWHNYSALGDMVCFDESLADDYMKNMKEFGFLKDYREYINLYNPYKDDETPNPHKSYGYLIQPKLAKWITEFLKK